MGLNLLLDLETYGKRQAVDLRMIAAAYVILALVVPLIIPLVAAPAIYKKCNRVIYL